MATRYSQQGLARLLLALYGKPEDLARFEPISVEEVVAWLLSDYGHPCEPSAVDRERLEEIITRALGQLRERAQEILRLRFGLLDGHPRTLEEISDQFGLSSKRIYRIQDTSLRKLRHPARLGIRAMKSVLGGDGPRLGSSRSGIELRGDQFAN